MHRRPIPFEGMLTMIFFLQKPPYHSYLLPSSSVGGRNGSVGVQQRHVEEVRQLCVEEVSLYVLFFYPYSDLCCQSQSSEARA